jgi:hypothetical protein
MNWALTISSSALVSAIVSAIATFVTQNRLASRKAQLDYEFNARKRLYETVGPLRFQLLLAARELLRRITFHPGSTWSMDPNEHYVRSFVYRLLKPLAIAQLIERQMTTSDFSVDSSAVDLVKFALAAPRTLSGSEVLLRHPDMDWSSQSQHVFYETSGAAASRLIIEQADQPPRVVGYREFVTAVPDLRDDADLRPFADLFAQCQENLTEKPILWLRIVAYGYTCSRFLDKYGGQIGIKPAPYPAETLLRRTQDDIIQSRTADYVRSFEKLTSQRF